MNPSQNILFLMPSLENPNLPFKLAIFCSAIQKPQKQKELKQNVRNWPVAGRFCSNDVLLSWCYTNIFQDIGYKSPFWIKHTHLMKRKFEEAS